MAELSSKDVYKFINEFETPQEFMEFGRSHLKLKNREINDVLSDYSGSREQKYQMISYWKRKIGRAGTINKLNELKNNFYAEDGDDDNAVAFIQQSSQDAGNASQPAAGGQQRVGLVNPIPPEADSVQQRDDNQEDPRQYIGVGGQRSGIIQENFEPPIGGRVLVDEQAARVIHDGPVIENFAALNISSRASRQSNGIHVEKEMDFCSDVTDFEVVPCTTEDVDIILSPKYPMRYPINNSPKGYVLIFDNVPTSQKSLGEKDVENMQRLWADLGCKVMVKKNTTAREIWEVIDKVVASPRISAFDFLVVFVMAKSDGNCEDEAFIAADEKPVVLKEILTKFESRNFEIFAGKPKLFFCQVFASKIEQPIKLRDVDQLLVLSHAPLCTSSRDTTGSWFLNAVTNIFKTHARKESVIEMLTRVGSAMESKIALAETSEPEHSICFSRTFAKNLYLLPGYPKDDLFD